MKKTITNLLLISTILVAPHANAICSTLASADDRSIPGDTWIERGGHMEYNILNQTATAQVYKICFKLITQTLKNTDIFDNSWCEEIQLAPGQSSGSVKRDPMLRIKYVKNSQGFYHIAIDSVVEVHGDCHSLSHDSKRIKVY
jgi:hypothetical protein